MRIPFLAILTSFILWLPLNAQAALEVGSAAPDFVGADVNGATVTLLDNVGSIVVLEWHNPQCPFVHKHYDSGNMQALQAYAHDKNVVWLTINSGGPGKEGNMTAQEAKEYIKKNNLIVTHYILDPTGVIGKHYGAKSTPHMFVIDAQGKIAYMGAIDDKPTPNPKDIPDAHNYVRAAIDSLLAGQPVATPSTQAYGCSVKYGD